MKIEHFKLYNNTKDLYMTPKIDWSKLKDRKNIFESMVNEKNDNSELINDFPVNKAIKYDQALMIKAIQFGMIILISYRGDKDNWKGGRERVICPLVIGQNRNTGNVLIRGFHMDGWSVSLKSNAKKVWRLFKAQNILSMMFTGDFFRLPPKGYKRNDRVMTETTFAAADFNVIRRNQFKLVQQGRIEDEEDTKIETGKVTSVEVKNTETTINLTDPWENNYFDKKNEAYIKVSFLKSVVGGTKIAVLGSQGSKGAVVKVYDGKKLLGTYKNLLSLPDPKSTVKLSNQFKKYRQVEGEAEWPLYTFVKKR